MIDVQEYRGIQFAARLGGFARAGRYPPSQLSAWSSMGGKALLRTRGRGYFRELRRKQKRRRSRVCQPSSRVIAARVNGQKGGWATTAKFGPEFFQQRARLGGLAVLTKCGNEHFRKLRKLRTKQDAVRKTYLQEFA